MIKEIEGFSNYFITDDGIVISKNKSKPKKLCQWIDNVGYKQVIIRKDKKKYYKRVHKLVAEAFIPNPENKPQVNHIDGDKINNKVENLEWTTNSENTQHGYDNDLYKSTYRCKVKAINKTTKEEYIFKSIRSCAEQLKLNRKTITSILKGEKNNNYNYYFEYVDKC